MPESYVAADAASLEGQRRFITSTRIQLLLLVVASAAGSFSWSVNEGWDATALLAGVAFSAAACLRVVLLRDRPHRVWYDGRAAAESIKTLAWKYAVAGDPFILEDKSADERFVGLVREVVSSFNTLGSPTADASPEPTDSMKALRLDSLAQRQEAYGDGRIADQREWYSRKAVWNKQRARFWGVIVLILQVLAAIGAFLKGFGVVEIDIFGLAGAAVGSAVAWFETKQHHTIARAYKVAAEELADIERLTTECRSDEEWAAFVAESEEAISREHTMWKASSRSREPVSLA